MGKSSSAGIKTIRNKKYRMAKIVEYYRDNTTGRYITKAAHEYNEELDLIREKHTVSMFTTERLGEAQLKMAKIQSEG